MRVLQGIAYWGSAGSLKREGGKERERGKERGGRGGGEAEEGEKEETHSTMKEPQAHNCALQCGKRLEQRESACRTE